MTTDHPTPDAPTPDGPAPDGPTPDGSAPGGPAPDAHAAALAAARDGAAWESWHLERLAAVTAPHGLAALVHTHWLTAEPTALDGAPGRWAVDGGVVVGSHLGGAGAVLRDPDGVRSPVVDAVRLVAGAELDHEGRVLRPVERDGESALRVLDPGAPGRTSLVGIAAHPHDPARVLEGTFTPAAPDAVVDVLTVDGHVTPTTPAGEVRFELDGEEVSLLVTSSSGGRLRAVFGDPTSGAETYPFRFLDTSAPDAEGRVVVDLNRAYLPPSAFADAYLCPTPVPGNRLPVPARAGERLPERS